MNDIGPRLEEYNQTGKARAGPLRLHRYRIDPTTGVAQRVWFNPETGERFYETV